MIRRVTSALALVAVTAASAAAQATTVYGSGTTFTNPGPSNIDDPSCSAALDTWCARNVRGGAQVGITSTYPQNGNGSMYFSSPDGGGKADAELYFASPFQLSNVSTMAYDWYRDAASNNADAQVASLRLILGSSASPTSYIGYLIYEPIYTESFPGNAIPEGVWHTSNIGTASKFWLNGNDGTYLTLATWQSGGGSAVGNRGVTGDTYVIGLSTGVGSGWANDFSGAVDNVAFSTMGAAARTTSYNFEVRGAQATVPEPGTYALLGAGLLGLGGVARRRRRNG